MNKRYYVPPPPKPPSRRTYSLTTCGLTLLLLSLLSLACILLFFSVNAFPASQSCDIDLETTRRKLETLTVLQHRTEDDLQRSAESHRALEADFRDLALRARASQAQIKPAREVNDVSTLQRLAKCRLELEDGVKTSRECEERSGGLEAQVGRLQKELKEAIAEADEQERLVKACVENRAGKIRGNSELLPPLPPRRK